MSEEKELIRKRGSFKGQLTLFTAYLGTLKESSLTQAEASQLQLRIGKIEALYELYDEVQLQLECISENLGALMSERDDFQNNYFSVLSRAQDMLSNFNKKRDEFESCSNRGSRSSSNNHKLVKLPTIQLPKFQGSYENWLGFRDTFTSLIHSNDDIDNVNKFHYLRASLEGSAALVINSIELSGNNYEIAWKLLCDRYDNKRILLQNHIAALFNVEPITKESSVHLKRIIDNVNKNLRCLESLGEPVKQWDTLLIYIVSKKLDTKTFREWEEHKGSLDNNVPISFDNFITFMRNRADLIETLELSSASGAGQSNQPAKNASKHRILLSTQATEHGVTTPPSKLCPRCNGEHSLNNCAQFLALSNADRLNLLPNYKVCFNCFRSGHFANRCKKAGCKICKRKHNSLVHITEHKQRAETNSCVPSAAQVGTAPSPAQAGNAAVTMLSVNMDTASSKMPASGQRVVVLATALIKVYGPDNRECIVKAALDNGSATCVITERLCSQLKLHVDHVNRAVVGINKLRSPVGKICQVAIKSLDDTYSTVLSCIVLPEITDPMPYEQIDISQLDIPSDLCLADPNFHTPSEIDILIGSDLFWSLLGTHRIKLGHDGQAVLWETALGYIVGGPIISGQLLASSHPIRCNFAKVIPSTSSELLKDEIQTQLTRFWQLEEVCPKTSHYSPEEKSCEKHFNETMTRLENGQFCVRLPLKEDPSVLGNSVNRARQCLFSLERRIESRPKFRDMYKEFMAEYESLNHMSECKASGLERQAYHIPHHGVLRENRITTKLRVVFNASALTSSGVSLNKIQMVGPTVQDDLLSILLRFRQHKYIISADVEKMYRRVVVHPEDRYLQRILWRDDPSKPLKIYELNTVTYGTASAPYLATRCLKQLGLECEDHVVRQVIIHDFYLDDLLTGGDDMQQVLMIKNRVSSTLASACMNLRKWKSNEPQLITDFDSSQLDLNIGTEPSKTLGLSWQPESDELCFPVGNCSLNANTKRDLLSAVAQIFDPTGVLAPYVILMKMLLQNLWLQKLSWDQELSPEISKSWENIIRDLPCLNDIRVPRLVLCDLYEEVECHVFTDASERAYGACLYLRSVDGIGNVLVRLLLAKSRVAPIKPTTIPRLELSGALAGVRLYEKVADSLRVKINTTTFWTDSTIVLGWLRMLPSKLQPFVRNRVAEILEKTGNCTWRHVPTHENPADHVSRGVPASLLKSLDVWWSGPTFLRQDKSQWPASPVAAAALPETRPEVSLHVNVTSGRVDENNDGFIEFSRFSNLSRLNRAVAYALRFTILCRKQVPLTSYLSDSELKTALNIVIKTSQAESFSEHDLLLNGQSLTKKSPLLKLNVFLDENKIMRVGGRLDNSNYSFEKKHPIVIHAKHKFTRLLFESEHKRLMHAGPQLLLSCVKDEYWPIGGTNLAKACFRKCLKCVRMKGQVVAPLMGNLPTSRVTPGLPFESVGVDYAGPLTAASRQGRGCRLVKVYIAIFVCFTTKAVHLELVGDLTSDNYLAALRRFVSRRGLPTDIYSDNGTSFVGAYNELSRFLKDNCNSLAEVAANEKVNFHFIPAYSPHSGGLWEAGVKSTKFHLKRVLGYCNLTYELLNTTLVQIEAICNSRPLTPISSDPEDLLPLTPGHFLIGRPLTSLPVKDIRERNYNHLNRYQRIEQLRQHFWVRWSKEYISELQVRTKWRTNNEAVQLNALVLIKEENLPPLKWKLGRIVATYPGKDGITRVADIRTATGLVRRSFSKICPLPVSAESD